MNKNLQKLIDNKEITDIRIFGYNDISIKKVDKSTEKLQDIFSSQNELNEYLSILKKEKNIDNTVPLYSWIETVNETTAIKYVFIHQDFTSLLQDSLSIRILRKNK